MSWAGTGINRQEESVSTEQGLQFDPKPRRATLPPQNMSRAIPTGWSIRCKLELDPARIAYFTREATWGDLMREPTPEDLADTLAEVASGRTLGASLEVPALAWRISASRACMDQMLRLRESAAGAQTTRDNDMRYFNLVMPETVSLLEMGNGDLWRRAEQLAADQRELYADLVDAGVPAQDARYVALPLGFQTQWVQIMDLRALTKLCEQRLCNGLTQHETNYLVRVMRDQVVQHYPWADKLLRSRCEKQGRCTSGGSLFPPCGAFGNVSTEKTERHVYSAEQNPMGMRHARWDRTRVIAESAGRGPIAFSTSRPWRLDGITWA